MPVVGAVNHLEPDALVEILTEPRNALVKQYRKIFEFENVELEFMPEALDGIAEEAIKRNTGARGLRSILEETLLETMYDIPGRDDVTKVVVTRECVVDDDVAPEVSRSAPTAAPASAPWSSTRRCSARCADQLRDRSAGRRNRRPHA